MPKIGTKKEFTCIACKDTGLNSKGFPCNVCILRRRNNVGPKTIVANVKNNSGKKVSSTKELEPEQESKSKANKRKKVKRTRKKVNQSKKENQTSETVQGRKTLRPKRIKF